MKEKDSKLLKFTKPGGARAVEKCQDCDCPHVPSSDK